VVVRVCRDRQEADRQADEVIRSVDAFAVQQNWQSEFIAVAAIVVLSVFLRQRSSAESKPVHHPHADTGS
jgi:hypothetical protein